MLVSDTRRPVVINRVMPLVHVTMEEGDTLKDFLDWFQEWCEKEITETYFAIDVTWPGEDGRQKVVIDGDFQYGCFMGGLKMGAGIGAMFFEGQIKKLGDCSGDRLPLIDPQDELHPV